MTLELKIQVQQNPKKLPYVPTEDEICNYYEAVWNAQNISHMVLIKTLLYTGMRVGELIKVKIEDVNLTQCQIRITGGKENKDRVVPYPKGFREILASHIKKCKEKKAEYLFESIRKGPYTDRGIRKILLQYTQAAKIKHIITPHKLRHFLLTWMKKRE